MEFPKVVKIRQHFTGPSIASIDETVGAEMERIQAFKAVNTGSRIAITVGSRGIANIPLIVRAVANELKKRGAVPIIIPSMGSHGGATADGQVEVLRGLGVTEAFCGAEIVSSMEVERIGETPGGIPVYCDKAAMSMDGIILLGRIKVHTDFKSPIGLESGLMKMAAIGLGKHKQALQIHTFGVQGIRDLMPEAARVVLREAKIVCGIGIVENALEQTAVIEAIPTDRIESREPELLRMSAALMPKLPIEDIDLLAVDEIGKDYSGTGMDTNIIGRIRIAGIPEPAAPRIKYVLASRLSEATHGNALGIGLADLTTKRLFDAIDFGIMNENVITSTFLHRAMIPIVLENDREAVKAAMRGNWGVERLDMRFVRIPDTLHLEYLYVSENLLPELQGLAHVEICGEPEELRFDSAGFFAQSFHE